MAKRKSGIGNSGRLRRKLRRMPDEARKAAQDGIEHAAELVKFEQLKRVPVDEGDLAASIEVQIRGDKLSARIGPGARTKKARDLAGWRAHFIEFGTAFAQARPFIFPALESQEKNVIQLINDGVGPIVAEGFEPMTSDSQWELQKAIYTALRTDATLIGLAGDGASPERAKVFDRIPQDTVFPYVRIGEGTARDWDTKSTDGQENTLTVHSFSQYSGFKEVKQIMGAIVDALDQATLSLTGPHIDIDSVRVFRSVHGSRRPDASRRSAATRTHTGGLNAKSMV